MQKKTLLAALLLFAVTTIGFSYNTPDLPRQNKDWKSANQVIDRTDKVLNHCLKITKEGGAHLGDLRLAFDHQKAAKMYLSKRDFQRAVNHSLRARSIATAQIKANHAKEIDEVNLSKDEKSIQVPSDSFLDKELGTISHK